MGVPEIRHCSFVQEIHQQGVTTLAVLEACPDIEPVGHSPTRTFVPTQVQAHPRSIKPLLLLGEQGPGKETYEVTDVPVMGVAKLAVGILLTELLDLPGSTDLNR